MLGCGVLLMGLAGGSTRAAVVPIKGVTGTSQFGAVDVFGDGNFSDVFVDDLISGSGLADVNGTPTDPLDDLHDNDIFSTNGWHAGDFAAGLAGAAGALDGDGDPFTAGLVDRQVLEFDLGKSHQLTKVHIWQQNQGGFFGPAAAPFRGVDEMEVFASSSESADDFTLVSKLRLQPEEGSGAVPAQVFDFTTKPFNARRVRFDLISALSGNPNEFVGLSEVRFEGTAITLAGDLDQDGQLSAADIDLLSAAVRQGSSDLAYDLDRNGRVQNEDRVYWVEQLKRTCFGDANLDGLFDTTDFVLVFQAGEYEDATAGNSKWATGDWNGDADFSSSDFITAFQAGCYERGTRAAVAAVPEPTCGGGWLIGSLMLAARRATRGRRCLR
jgi:hypothetical protein